MENLESLLKKIEMNYHNKDKKEKTNFELNGETYEVILLTRKEKADLIFSKEFRTKENIGDVYKWLKPTIYKSFQLKEAAIQALNQGYIKTHYDVIDFVFAPEDIPQVINFMFEANNIKNFIKEEIEILKK